MRHPKTIEQRAFRPSEPRGLVLAIRQWDNDPNLKALALPPHNGEKQAFPTIAQACDYARSRVPEEATC